MLKVTPAPPPHSQPAPVVDPPSTLPDMIAAAGKEQANLKQLLGSLAGRIRELEAQNSQLRVSHASGAQTQDIERAAEIEKREKLQAELAQAQAKLQTVSHLLEEKIKEAQELAKTNNQNLAIIEANRKEIQALTEQVKSEREQVQVLSGRLDAALTEITELRTQLNQTAAAVAAQQRQILESQRQQAALIEKMQQPDLNKILTAVTRFLTLQGWSAVFNEE